MKQSFSSMDKTAAQIAFRNYFFFGVVEGVFSFYLILSLPKDPDSGWFFGLSPFRLSLLIIAVAILVLLLWLAGKARRDTEWVQRWIDKITFLLQKEKTFIIVTSVLLVLFFLGTWFLVSTYTHSSYRIRPYMLETIETIRAYMLRFAPFVFLGTAFNGQTILLFHRYGLGSREKYYRIISNFSLIIIPFLLLVFFIVNSIDDNYYRFITNEDNLVEWLTVAFLILTGVFSLLKAHHINDRKTRQFWFFILFAFASVLFVLEEMSWGQRIFDIQSPQFFEVNSDQQEINIHNVVQEWFSFRTKHVVAVVLFAYGTCLPLLGMNRRFRAFWDRLDIPISPLVLTPGFLLSAILMLDVFSGKEEEVGELCFSICLFLFMVLEYLHSEKKNTAKLIRSES